MFLLRTLLLLSPFTGLTAFQLQMTSTTSPSSSTRRSFLHTAGILSSTTLLPSPSYASDEDTSKDPYADFLTTESGLKYKVIKEGNGSIPVSGATVKTHGKFLKSKNAECKVIALEPTESRVHTGAKPGPHGIVGWAPGVHSKFIEGVELQKDQLSDAPRGVVDEWGHVTTKVAVATCLKVTQTEGMMIGPSSGAALAYAFEVAARPEAKGKTIVVIIPSHGIRYVAHPLWGAVSAEANTALPSGVPPCSDKEAPALLWDSGMFTPP